MFISLEEITEFFINHFIISTIWFIILFVVIFLSVQSILYRHYLVSNFEAIQLINKKQAIVIDIRNINDYSTGHIIWSIHISPKELEKSNYFINLTQQNKPILIVCRDGSSSCALARRLIKSGCKFIYVLKNGIAGWNNANLPLIHKNNINTTIRK